MSVLYNKVFHHISLGEVNVSALYDALKDAQSIAFKTCRRVTFQCAGVYVHITRYTKEEDFMRLAQNVVGKSQNGRAGRHVYCPTWENA